MLIYCTIPLFSAIMSRQISAKKRVQYSPDSMALANGKKRSDEQETGFNYLWTTLLDKLAGRVPEEPTRQGQAPILTKAEEYVLGNYCNLMAEIGYPLKREELKKEVKNVLDSDGRATPFKDNKPGDYWFRAFMNRHPPANKQTFLKRYWNVLV